MLPFNTSGSIDSTQTKLFFTHPANANKKVTFHNRRWFLIQEIQSKRLFFFNFWKYTVSKSHRKYKFLIAVDRLRVHQSVTFKPLVLEKDDSHHVNKKLYSLEAKDVEMTGHFQFLSYFRLYASQSCPNMIRKYSCTVYISTWIHAYSMTMTLVMWHKWLSKFRKPSIRDIMSPIRLYHKIRLR